MIKVLPQHFTILWMAVFLLLSIDAGSQVVSNAVDVLETQHRPVSRYLSLKKALNDIERRFDVNIIFQSKIAKDKTVKAEFIEEQGIDATLEKLLSPHGLAYTRVGEKEYIVKPLAVPSDELSKIPRKQLTLEDGSVNRGRLVLPVESAEKFFTAGRKRLQERIITGKVLDENGEPLPGANVLVKGTSIGTVSDVDGNYTLSIPDDATVLVFSFVGYTTEEIEISGQSIINTTLYPDITTLTEVVVIGYGEEQKKDLVGAVSQIESRQIEELPITTFEQALSGQISGLQIRQTGLPGGGPEVLIRGIGSIGTSNAPLFVVDGFPLGNADNKSDNFVLGSISPDEIESISVLKDATSKAIYGSRAAGGVIIIKTKQGKKGRPKIAFNSYVGIQEIPDYEKPDVLNATELAQFQQERIIDNIRVLEGREPTEEDIPEQFRNPERYGEGTNWFDEITRTAAQQNYNISITGGNDNVQYAVTASYLDQEGTLINTDFKRYNFRANVNVKINDKIRYGISIAPSHAIRNISGAISGTGQFSVYSALASSYWADPSATVNNPDGTLANTTLGELLPFYTASPVAQLTQTFGKARTNQVLLSNFLQVEFIPGLTAKSTLNVFYTDRRTRSFRPSFLPGQNLTPNVNGSGVATAGITDLANFNFINENTLTYERTIREDHSITGLVGVTFEDRQSESTTVSSRNILDESLIIPASGNTAQDNVANFTGGGGFEGNALLSFISRLNYSFRDKYYFTVAYRRDGSSRFGEDVRFANFPAASAAWRISSEGFFQNSGLYNVISELKLEVGYGLTGNNGIGNFQAQGRVDRADYVIGGEQVLGNFVSSVPASETTWEVSEQLDIGLDVGLFTNKFNIGIDLYRTESRDFLTSLPLPRTTGFASILDNSGTIINKGIEVEIGTTDLVRSGKFTYDVNMNFTRNINEVVEIDNTLFRGAAGNGTQFTITQEGEPVGQFYGLVVTGLFTEEEINDPDVPKYAGAQVGSIKYLDVDGDGRLEQFEDYDVIGDPLPDLLFGMTHNFRYDNFDLRIVMSGALGQQIFELRREVMSNFDGVFNLHSEVKDRYRPGDDPTTKRIPTTVGQTNRWRIPSSSSVFDASYLFVRNITLGYNLPRGQFGNFLTSARIYASVQNPVVFSEYDRGNPEIGRVGDNALVRNVNNGQYPISRVYTLGFNVTF